MRTGKYEASDGGNSAGTAVTFLLIGLGAGALLGLLLAPKAGQAAQERSSQEIRFRQGNGRRLDR